MAEEIRAEGTAQQESPTVEQTQPEAETTLPAEKPVQTQEDDAEGESPEEKNWKALREEKDRLARENEELKKRAGVGKPELEQAS